MQNDCSRDSVAFGVVPVSPKSRDLGPRQWYRSWDNSAYSRSKKKMGGRKHGALRPQKPLRFIRDGEVEGSGLCFYLKPTRYTVTTRMTLH